MATQPPNVLFIAVDDLNQWPRCLGKHPDAITPNIDRLASRGTLFNNAHTTAPVCLPARVAALSGLSPSTTGCYALCPPVSDSNAWTRSEALGGALPLPLFYRRAGYRTMVSGKIFHGGQREEAEAAEAYDEPLWDEDNHAAARGANQLQVVSPAYSWMDDVLDSGRSVHWGPLEGEQAESMTDNATVDWCVSQLAKRQDRPFLVACGLFKPHVPLHAPKECFDLYDPDEIEIPEPSEAALDALPEIARGIALSAGNNHDHLGGTYYQLRRHGRLREFVHAYLASMTYLDRCLGRILDVLDASPYASNTIVAFWADHGWSLGQHFHVQKSALWDCVTNVPLIIADPSRRPNICNTPVSTLDLYPTLADLCGLSPRPEWEGHSLRTLMDEPNAPWPHAALTSFGPGNTAVRASEGTYIRYCDGSEELYDPTADPREERNLAADPDADRLRTKLSRHLPTSEVPPLHQGSQPVPEQLSRMAPGTAVGIGVLRSDIAGEPISVSAQLNGKGDGTGIIAYFNGIHTGFALYLEDRCLHFALRNVPTPLRWDSFTPSTEILRLDRPLPRAAEIEVSMDAQGRVTFRIDSETREVGAVSGPLAIQPQANLYAGFIRESDKLSQNVPLIPNETYFRNHPATGLDWISVRFGPDR